MKVSKHIIIIICSLALLLGNCKKYPEGGFINRGDNNIIGNWELITYEVNGIDSTSLINYNGNEDYKNVSFYKEQTHYNPNLYCTIKYQSENVVTLAKKTIAFRVNDPTYSQVGYYSVIGTNNQVYSFRLIFTPEGGTTDWEIRKLNKREFILKTTKQNTYTIKLKKK